MKILNKRFFLFMLAFISLVALFSLNAYAGVSPEENDLVRIMCNALNLVTGGTGRTIAAFAVIALGVGFFLGKINWGVMLAVALGIAALFGGPTIVAAIAGGEVFDCSIYAGD